MAPIHSRMLAILLVTWYMAGTVFAAQTRCAMYLTGQHPVVPSKDLVKDITHVALAFMNSATFNADKTPSDWPLFTTVAETKTKFAPETKIMVAIGGWGDTAGFEEAAKDDISRKRWARNVAAMVNATGADGVDVDWEYPGGNGEDYKKVPNSSRAWEIQAYPLLLAELRAALGSKLISAAVPGLERDMLAFTHKTTTQIAQYLDFINVMTYDLMNRRDTVTKHHTGLVLSLKAIDAYASRGAPVEKMNLGFAFYVKWFKTEQCPDRKNPVGCPTQLLEDPETGADMGKTGGFSWHDGIPDDVSASFARAQSNGTYDDKEGGYYYWDPDENIWWSYDTPEAIIKKFPLIVEKKSGLGVFAWGLGEDAPEFAHLKAVNKALAFQRDRQARFDEL